jgi:myosin heavy subunit
MEHLNEGINNRIEEKFNLIENKLRNSFQAIKQDNDFIKKKIQELNILFETGNTSKVLTDFNKLRAETNLDFADLKKTLTSNIESLKKNIKEEVKTSLRKEVYSEFEKKIDKKFEKFEKTSKNTKDDFSFHKKDIQKQVDCMGKRVNDFQDSLNRNLEDKKTETVNQVKTQNSSLKRDVSNWKRYFSERIDSDLKARDEKITKLEHQIAYLKGRIKSNSEQEYTIEVTKEDKNKVKNKKSEDKNLTEKRNRLREMFANVVNSLADPDNSSNHKKNNKQQYKSVIKPVKKNKNLKEVKKLEKSNDKNFLTKIVDSLSD